MFIQVTKANYAMLAMVVPNLARQIDEQVALQKAKDAKIDFWDKDTTGLSFAQHDVFIMSHLREANDGKGKRVEIQEHRDDYGNYTVENTWITFFV